MDALLKTFLFAASAIAGLVLAVPLSVSSRPWSPARQRRCQLDKQLRSGKYSVNQDGDFGTHLWRHGAVSCNAVASPIPDIRILVKNCQCTEHDPPTPYYNAKKKEKEKRGN